MLALWGMRFCLREAVMRGSLAGFLFGLALLCGCDASPAPVFFGAARHDVTLQGYRFTVLVKGDHAEVIRLGYLRRAERNAVPPLMIAAAEQASGCKVTGPATGLYRSPALPGDTGEARFRLKC
jgi:ribosomal protein S14